ncbi:hypothetical protein GOP47_0011762 [Adiantum capillus-veneris]|uniref:Uncharacterized protein n=1 Tax=Adiantum capillus-veneris TaxID=13818 RepID=A0A9D4ZFP5_ADICA|nr:hypothetical protein GOP47_0011762 [Adiantum capillus-veneris]
MGLQRVENGPKVQFGENFSNMIVLHVKACFCDDFEKKYEQLDVFQDNSDFFEEFMQFLKAKYDSGSAQIEEDFIELLVYQTNSDFCDDFDENHGQVDDVLFEYGEEDTNLLLCSSDFRSEWT